MPKDATITFSKDGDILVNGKPRYLPATIFYEMTDLETEAHTVGYPDDLKWLYEQMPDYEAAQRLGFDALGSYATLEWMKLYRDGFGGRRQNPKQMERFLKSGLGIYVDYTASEWWHGSMFPGDTMWPYQMPERKEKHFRAVLHKPNSTNPIPPRSLDPRPSPLGSLQPRAPRRPRNLVHPVARRSQVRPQIRRPALVLRVDERAGLLGRERDDPPLLPRTDEKRGQTRID